MRHLVLALAGTAVLVLALSACGDDDDSGSSATADQATTITEITTAGGETTTEGGSDTSDTTATTGAAAGEGDTTTTAGGGGTATTATGTDGGVAITEALRDAGLGTLASALEAAGVDQVIDTDEFTVFAPDEEAFLALDTDILGELVADPSLVAEILRNHVVGERLTAEELVAQGQVETRAGTTLEVTSTGDDVVVGEATVVEADREVGDVGVIHVVDAVILPSD